MHERPIRSYQTHVPINFWPTKLVPVARQYSSLPIITSRIFLTVQLTESWLAYLQKISFQSIYNEPPVPALTEAFPYITTHYSGGTRSFNIERAMLHTSPRWRIHFPYRRLMGNLEKTWLETHGHDHHHTAR